MMAFTGNTVGFSCGLARRNDDGAGRRGDGRGAVIGEGADARQAAIGRTGHRGASQHEGGCKDEAEGPHLTVSGCPPPALSAVLVGPLITMRRFRSSAPKRKMVSSPGRIVSSPPVDETISPKPQLFQTNGPEPDRF